MKNYNSFYQYIEHTHTHKWHYIVIHPFSTHAFFSLLLYGVPLCVCKKKKLNIEMILQNCVHTLTASEFFRMEKIQSIIKCSFGPYLFFFSAKFQCESNADCSFCQFIILFRIFMLIMCKLQPKMKPKNKNETLASSNLFGYFVSISVMLPYDIFHISSTQHQIIHFTFIVRQH